MGNIQFIRSGETELPAGWALQPHTHDFFHLAYVHSGQLIFQAGGQDYPLSTGSVILISPGTIHGVPKDAHNLCIQFEVFFRILDPELKSLLENKTVLTLHNAFHLESLFSYILMYYGSVDPLCSSCADSFLCTILLSFLADTPSSKGNSGTYVDSSQYSPLVQQIIHHVEKDSNEKYVLSTLSDSLGFNKNYLCTAFRRETGITISEYINYHRLRRIMSILQYTNYNKDFPIHELVDQFGYVNTSYFNRVFKKYTGMTPTEFTNALSEDQDGPKQAAFRKYYHEYVDLNRYPIRESLEYMRGMKGALENNVP
ncbi:MAG: AraC family transcriptional regulator [Firmicutes bacterium]|nr:AraC family transcriptional regulator [Bacillota bacterium]MBQ6684505.1 AraC family transcriptional regulator [Bacillota bacterium]